MKRLVSPGNTLSITANLRTPVRRGDKWPNHGTLLSITVLNFGPNDCFPSPLWKLKDGSTNLYFATGTTLDVANNERLCLIGTVTIRGLLGGEFYNKFIRNRCIGKT